MANIIEVARAAQVSPATASRALNNSHLVSSETKARVLAAAARLGYQLPVRQPEPEATPAGGLLVGIGVEHVMLQDYLLRQAEALHGCAVFLPMGIASAESFRRTVSRTLALLQQRHGLQALVLGDGAVSLLEEDFFDRWQGIPLVQLAERRDAATQTVVSIDYVQAAYDATQALLELGRRRICLLTQPLAEARLRADTQCLWGYQAAMGDAGATPWIDHCDPTRDSGIEWLTARLAAGEALPEAIICRSDHAAIGCIQALYRAGVSVPGQTAVLSLGCESGLGYASSPVLSTVEGKMEQIGNAVTQLLQQQLAGTDEPHRVIIPHTFFCRGSIPPLNPTRWPVFD